MTTVYQTPSLLVQSAECLFHVVLCCILRFSCLLSECHVLQTSPGVAVCTTHTWCPAMPEMQVLWWCLMDSTPLQCHHWTSQPVLFFLPHHSENSINLLYYLKKNLHKSCKVPQQLLFSHELVYPADLFSRMTWAHRGWFRPSPLFMGQLPLPKGKSTQQWRGCAGAISIFMSLFALYFHTDISRLYLTPWPC